MFHPDFPQMLRQPGRKRQAIAILVVALVAAAWFCFVRLWTAANILPVENPIPFTAEEVAWFEEISAFSLAPFASGHRFDHPDEIETFCTFLESLQCYEAEPDAYLLQLDEGRQIDVHLQGGSVVKLRLMFQHSRLRIDDRLYAVSNVQLRHWLDLRDPLFAAYCAREYDCFRGEVLAADTTGTGDHLCEVRTEAGELYPVRIPRDKLIRLDADDPAVLEPGAQLTIYYRDLEHAPIYARGAFYTASWMP